MKLATPYIHDSHTPQSGFTLVEMLVVAPLVILLVGVIIGFMTTITGDAIATNNRGSVVFSAQQALDMMERDVRLSSGFLVSSGPVATQQRPPAGTSTFEASSNYLILEQNATSNNPYSSDRKLVYYKNQPNACGSTEAINNSLRVKLIYYLYKDSGASTGTLYKRTLVPSYSPSTSNDEKSTCSAPWHANSCSDGFVTSSSSPCRVRDEKIATDISSLGLQYYVNASSSAQTTNPAEANSIRIEVKTSNNAAGKTAGFTGAVRASKLNPSEALLQAPVKPIVSSVPTSPTTMKFVWEVPDNMTFYDARYGINAACTTVALTNSRSSSWEIAASPGDTINFCLTAKNLMGSSAAQQAIGKLPIWATLRMQNDWADYASSFHGFGFTKTSTGEVFVRGLVARPTAYTGKASVIATLPEGYRPTHDLIINTTAYKANDATASINGEAMVVVRRNGDIEAYKANSGQINHTWISLAPIKFMSTGSCSWTVLTLDASKWGNFGGTYPTESVCVDSTNRAHIQGMVTKGPASYLPGGGDVIGYTTNSSFAPTERHIIAGRGEATYSPLDINKYTVGGANGLNTEYRYLSSYTEYNSHQAAYYTQNYTGTWHNLNLLNGWANNGGTFAKARCTYNNGVVTIHGLIKGGNAANYTTLATLPAGCPPPSNTDIQPGITLRSNILTHARIDIKSTGELILIANGASDWISLNDISYVVD